MSHFIELGGGQTPEVTAIPLPHRARNQRIREGLAGVHYDASRVAADNREVLAQLAETPFRTIGQQFVKGDPLSFEHAFLGMTYVVAATNRGMFGELKPALQRAHGLVHLRQEELVGPAQTFLTAMAQREVHSELTPDEVAGMTAASMMDLTIRVGFNPYILETGGMGGDKGFIIKGEKKKVINASTLSSIVLASLEVPVMKHGSYGNTSSVGSTDAIESLGVNIYQTSLPEIRALFEQTGFYFSDAHIVKTIHDLSHSPFMRHETVNHLIGPMTPPVDRETTLHKVIGVNEGVHPSVIGRAYETLHEKGYQKVGNVVAVSGLSEDIGDDVNVLDLQSVRPFMMLDEISPYLTLLGVVQNGTYRGSFLIQPEDFGVSLDPQAIQVATTREELIAANGQALQGLSGASTDYLAMNAALGLFTAEFLGRADAIQKGRLNSGYLREAFSQCRNALASGQAAQHLEKIVQVSTNI